MGQLIGKVLGRSQPKVQRKIIVVGDQQSGKSTIVYSIKLGKIVPTPKTTDFNYSIEKYDYQNVDYSIWDIGGPIQKQEVVQQLYIGAEGIILVVDMSKENGLKQGQEGLNILLQQTELQGIPILVLAHKTEETKNSLQDVIQALGLNDVIERKWIIKASSTLNLLGVSEGFQQMHDLINKQN